MFTVFLISNCTKEAQIKIFTPAEINTINLKNIAVGEFEIGQIILKNKTERKSKNAMTTTKNKNQKKQFKLLLLLIIINCYYY